VGYYQSAFLAIKIFIAIPSKSQFLVHSSAFRGIFAPIANAAMRAEHELQAMDLSDVEIMDGVRLAT
jgi:hypothetical protein